ncbi:MAG: metallophosphoesterase family protein [Candidatus Aenigmatarchaeota archaeon]
MADPIKKLLERGVIVGQDAAPLLTEELVEKIISSGFNEPFLAKKHIEPFLSAETLKIISAPIEFKEEYEISDFANYYEKKYEKIRGVLGEKLPDPVSINKLALGKKCSIIGVVREAQGDDMVFEDKTGRVTAVVQSEKLEQGDVIGLAGNMGNEKFFAEEIIFPDVSVKREIGRLEEGIRAIFIADIHYGAQNFKKELFDNFIRWLEEKNADIVLIAGDISNNGDYEFLERIPEKIPVVIIPGETDSGALQPLKPIKTRTKRRIYSLPNPGKLVIEDRGKIEILLYHPSAKKDSQPENFMLSMVRKRHFTPRQFLPIQGQFVLESEPDIIFIGHFHKPAIKNYKSVTLLSGGSFVDDPTFPVVNLKTRETSTVKF